MWVRCNFEITFNVTKPAPTTAPKITIFGGRWCDISICENAISITNYSEIKLFLAWNKICKPLKNAVHTPSWSLKICYFTKFLSRKFMSSTGLAESSLSHRFWDCEAKWSSPCLQELLLRMPPAGLAGCGTFSHTKYLPDLLVKNLHYRLYLPLQSWLPPQRSPPLGLLLPTLQLQFQAHPLTQKVQPLEMKELRSGEFLQTWHVI